VADVRGEPVLGLRERKKRRTRATLIDAAVGLCDSQGFDDTTVDQIAAIADVSPRTFSRYFSTKDAIELALMNEVLDKVADFVGAMHGGQIIVTARDIEIVPYGDGIGEGAMRTLAEAEGAPSWGDEDAREQEPRFPRPRPRPRPREDDEHQDEGDDEP
jgi:AcrR family transcriptional regulator